jgi:hypothetical protein
VAKQISVAGEENTLEDSNLRQGQFGACCYPVQVSLFPPEAFLFHLEAFVSRHAAYYLHPEPARGRSGEFAWRS